MKALYTKDSIIGKLQEKFSAYFMKQTKPTSQHLFDLVLSVLELNRYQSVKYNYEHSIADFSDSSLNAYYYTLNESKIDLSDWMEALTNAALFVIPTEYSHLPIVLAIDDTLIEKSGTVFENCGRLFDHTRRNGSDYLNGHCFVSLLLQIPVKEREKYAYLPIPVGYRMWDESHSKLEIAAEMVKSVMKVIGEERSVILCCDSWYPKGAVNKLVGEFDNLALICNARLDTVLYNASTRRSGKRGRPRIKGERIDIKTVELTEVADTDYCVGTLSVKTELFGNQIVQAIVTKTRKEEHYRLFLCTKDPSEIEFDLNFLQNSCALAYAQANPEFLPLAIYSLRWNIEVTYYEQKNFWGLGKYMLESKTGIVRMVNLLSLIYAALRLLPYQLQDFSVLRGLSVQEIRFVLGRLIHRQIILSHFSPAAENGKKSDILSISRSLVG